MADVDLELHPFERAVRDVESAVEDAAHSINVAMEHGSDDLESFKTVIREDLKSLEGAVERVETAVQRAAKSIDESLRERNQKEWSWLPLFLILVVAGVFSLSDEAWHSKLRYAVQYGTDIHKVTIGEEPYDCEFFSAPVGNKHCHYERSVSTVRWATSTDGLPIVSVDDGKTWSTFTPDSGVTVPKYSTLEEVEVSWEKQDD